MDKRKEVADPSVRAAKQRSRHSILLVRPYARERGVGTTQGYAAQRRRCVGEFVAMARGKRPSVRARRCAVC